MSTGDILLGATLRWTSIPSLPFHVKETGVSCRRLIWAFGCCAPPPSLPGRGGAEHAFPLLFQENPASRTSVIPIPNIVSFQIPHPVPIKFQPIPLPGQQSNPLPVNFSRIPHCILVKSRIPGTPFQTRIIVRQRSFPICLGRFGEKHLIFLITVDTAMHWKSIHLSLSSAGGVRNNKGYISLLFEEFSLLS